MGIFSIFVINTVHYQQFIINQTKKISGYNEQKKYKR